MYGHSQYLHLIVKNKQLIKLTFVLIVFSFFSCTNSIKTAHADRDKTDIYNLALDNTIGSDTLWRHSKIAPRPSFEQDSLEFLKYSHWKDSIQSILDTVEFFVVVNREIDTLSGLKLNEIISNINSKGDLQYDKDFDTSFNEIVKKLSNTKTDHDTLLIQSFISKFHYKIYADGQFPNDNLGEIGSISFSRIEFNNQKNKAAVYTSFNCGRLCGNGQILFFAKENGNWAFCYRWDLWVS